MSHGNADLDRRSELGGVHRRLLWAVAHAFLIVLALAGCTPSGGASSDSRAVELLEEPLPEGGTLQESPPAASIPVTVQRQFFVTLLRARKRHKTLLTGVTWSVSDTTVASVDSTGLVTALHPGTVIVTAAYQGKKAASALTVTSAKLVSLEVDPPARHIQVGTHVSFRATGTFSDGRTFPLRGAVAWLSTDSAVATVDQDGRASGMTPGISAVQATHTATGLSAKGFLTVGSASLKSLAIAPPAPSTKPGSSVPFTVTGAFSDSSTQDLTDTATWSSSTPSVATISNASGSQGVATAAAAGTTTIKAVVGRKMVTAHLTVTSATLVSVAVTPATTNIPNGLTAQLVATGTYSDHTTQDITALVTWKSSSAVVFISNATGSSGLATAMAEGTATVTATDVSGLVGTATVTVTAAVLKALSVMPPTATMPVGLTQQYVASGTFTDATIRDLTSSVTWSSTSLTVAEVSSAGLASALVVGTTTISALDPTSGITASAPLTVSPAVLESIAITPASASIANGLTRQLAATGTFSDGSHVDLTSTVSWSVPSGTAVVSVAGLVTSNGVGPSTIEAAMGSITAQATINVTAATIVSIQVTPALPSLPIGATRQFAATAIFTDGSTMDVTSVVTWSATNINAGNPDATLSNAADSRGLATATAVGSATITATYPPAGPSGSTILTVTPAALVSIAVTPASPSLPAGTAQQFAATGMYTDGTTQDLTTSVTWSSNAPTVLSVSASTAAGPIGLGSALTPGSAVVSATYPAASTPIVGSTQVTVTSALLVSIAVSPSAPTIALGQTQQFTATGTYTDASTQDVTTAVTWTSSTAAATISNASGTNGQATSAGLGVTTITATLGTVSGATALTVTSSVLVSIAVTPSTQSVPLGLSQQFTATGTFSDGTTEVLTSSVTWSSSGPSATVSNASGSQGRATASAPGTATISAIAAGTTIEGSATMVTTAAVLQSMQVTPPTPGVQVGLATQLVATGTYSDGSSLDLTGSVTWTSSDATLAVVSNATTSAGVVQGIAVGTAILTATDPASGVSGSVPIAITAQGTFGAVVGSAGGKVGAIINGGGVTVTIPAGALSQTLTITATPVASPGPGSFGQVYDLEPTGTQFAAPVTVTLPYTLAELGGISAYDFGVSTFVGGAWQPDATPVVDTNAGTISGTQTHFSLNGVSQTGQCDAAGTPPANGIWDFYSYDFVMDGTAENDASITLAGQPYGEIILYGPGSNLTTGTVCGAVAGLSVGYTDPNLPETYPGNYTGASLVLEPRYKFVSTTLLWNAQQITSMSLVVQGDYPSDLGIAAWTEELSDSFVTVGELNSSITGMWKFKSHWQSAWPGGPGLLPTSTLPPGISQPTPPEMGFPTPNQGELSQGEFTEPPAGDVDLPNNGCAGGSTSQTCPGSSSCVNLESNPAHCGGCDTPCGAGLICAGGACVSPCGSLSNCGGNCVNEQNDPNNCGGCAAASLFYTCPPTATCVAGECQCPAGNTMCDDAQRLPVCVDIETDPNNCGGCGNVCSSGSCNAGSCCTGCASPNVCCASSVPGTSSAIAESCTSACSAGQTILCAVICPGCPPSNPTCITSCVPFSMPCPAGMNCVPFDGTLGPLGYGDYSTCQAACRATGSACASGATCCSGSCSAGLCN
jgi:hypothetical protein